MVLHIFSLKIEIQKIKKRKNFDGMIYIDKYTDNNHKYASQQLSRPSLR